jgi:hypothetical protein
MNLVSIEGIHPLMPSNFIEATLISILSEIEKRPAGNPKISLKRIACDRLDPGCQITEREVTYCWPGKNRNEAWRFGIETLDEF